MKGECLSYGTDMVVIHYNISIYIHTQSFDYDYKRHKYVLSYYCLSYDIFRYMIL